MTQISVVVANVPENRECRAEWSIPVALGGPSPAQLPHCDRFCIGLGHSRYGNGPTALFRCQLFSLGRQSFAAGIESRMTAELPRTDQVCGRHRVFVAFCASYVRMRRSLSEDDIRRAAQSS